MAQWTRLFGRMSRDRVPHHSDSPLSVGSTDEGISCFDAAEAIQAVTACWPADGPTRSPQDSGNNRPGRVVIHARRAGLTPPPR